MSAVLSSEFRNPSRRRAAHAPSTVPLSSLLYESEAVSPLSDDELQRLLDSCRARNLRHGITGLLIYDQGRFLQWLEGPTETLGRLWESISRDTRHTSVRLLGASSTPARFFSGSAMALGQRGGDYHPASTRISGSVIDVPPQLIDGLYRSPRAAPSALANLVRRFPDSAFAEAGRQASPTQAALRALVDEVIVPELLLRQSAPRVEPIPADPRAAELARLLVAAKPRAAFDLIDTLRGDGRSITQLCTGLFEPASRALGDLWQSDDCSDIEVTLGLCHLQAALRRASLETSSADIPTLQGFEPHSVLVAPSPTEPHMLGSVMASEKFWRAGWDVRCEFPVSDEALVQLVHDRWFDVLDLSLSGAFTRQHRLPAMAASIRAAYANSMNPGLTVIVDGRVFHEQPKAVDEVGADRGSANAPEALRPWNRR